MRSRQSVVIYLAVLMGELRAEWNIHTHTHTYIYIYIQLLAQTFLVSSPSVEEDEPVFRGFCSCIYFAVVYSQDSYSSKQMYLAQRHRKTRRRQHSAICNFQSTIRAIHSYSVQVLFYFYFCLR